LSVWQKFWDGWNIRKFIVFVVLGLYGLHMFNTGQDLGIRDILLIVIGYYFGYSNGQPSGKDGAGK
jgi:hypothetical protein